MRGVETLADLLAGLPTVALTGAGCSTESGIPDYRGPRPSTAKRARNPMQYKEFVHSAESRRRYWARSMVGWQRIASAMPNPAHHALAEMEMHGLLKGVITQNVDRLHRRAGSRRVIELHGALAEVRCLACRASEPRAELQRRLVALNDDAARRLTPVEIAPDGDAELDAAINGFRIAPCRECGGVLKPDVVFFGESVPKPRVQAAYELLAEARALLVVGSSLAVFSGFRFVRAAAARAIPIVMINVGESRGDSLATLRIEARAGEALPALVDALQARGRASSRPESALPVSSRRE